MRRILAISSIGNQPHNLHGKYIPGSGVGASSISNRRLKLHRSAECYPQPQIQYLRVSDIATYYDPDPNDGNRGYWILNESTVITQYQYLIIYGANTPENPYATAEDLHIPYTMTFTNNGRVDNNGSFTMEYSVGGVTSIVYNTGVFNNYGSLIVNICKFYTYGGGSVYNSMAESPAPVANISIDIINTFIGIFAFPLGTGCGSGTFTGKTVVTRDGVPDQPPDYVCPP